MKVNSEITFAIVDFLFQLRCDPNGDVVTIYTKEEQPTSRLSRIDSYCDKMPPRLMSSPSGWLVVEFNSSSKPTKQYARGFRGYYRFVKGFPFFI